MILIDEVLTPDSSRFWDASTYEPGRAQDSYDKQYVRDYLETLDWGKTYPGPELPDEVVAGTRQRYVEAFERITGGSFERYLQSGRDRVMGCVPLRRRRSCRATASSTPPARRSRTRCHSSMPTTCTTCAWGGGSSSSVDAEIGRSTLVRRSTRWRPTSWPIR